MMDVISGQVPDRFRADHPEFTADSLFGYWTQSKQVRGAVCIVQRALRMCSRGHLCCTLLVLREGSV